MDKIYGYRLYNRSNYDHYINWRKSVFIDTIDNKEDQEFYKGAFGIDTKRRMMYGSYIIILANLKTNYLEAFILRRINYVSKYLSKVYTEEKTECNICYNDVNTLYSCYRCNYKYCDDCYNKYHEKKGNKCPHCSYTLYDHMDVFIKKDNK